MGIVVRQSIKSTIVTLFGAVLGGIIVLASTYLLPVQYYGFIKNITNQALTFSYFLLIGVPSTLIVYIHKYQKDAGKRKALIGFSFLIPIITSTVFFIIYNALRNPIINHYQPIDRSINDQYFYLLPVFVLLLSLVTLFESYLNSQMRVALSSFMQAILIRVLTLILLVLTGYNIISTNTFFYGMVLMYTIPIFAMWCIAKYKTDNFSISLNWQVFEKKERKELLHFAWYHLLLSASLTLLGTLDANMLAFYSHQGISDVGIYANAVFIISLFSIPYRSMSVAVFSSLTQAYHANEMEKVNDIYNRASNNILFATVAMGILIALNLDNAVAILPSAYSALKPLVLILMLGRLVDMATGLNSEIMSISKHYKSFFLLSLALVLMILIFNRISIPLYGVYGAAWATSIALCIFNIGKYLLVKRKLQLVPFTKNSFLTIICGILIVVVFQFIPTIINVYIDLVLRSLIGITLFLAIVLKYKLVLDVNEFVSKIKSSRRLF
jgi:O-antigen/teichoic acid export membrane protein